MGQFAHGSLLINSYMAEQHGHRRRRSQFLVSATYLPSGCLLARRLCCTLESILQCSKALQGMDESRGMHQQQDQPDGADGAQSRLGNLKEGLLAH